MLKDSRFKISEALKSRCDELCRMTAALAELPFGDETLNISYFRGAWIIRTWMLEISEWLVEECMGLLHLFGTGSAVRVRLKSKSTHHA